MSKTTKPNFIIIGAMKAATTSLHFYLKQHPNIFMPDVKEPMFFNSLKKNNYFIKGKQNKKITSFEKYYALFKNANEKAIGEASPGYIYNKYCADLIKKNLPDVKIIAVLRQPIERAYSNFLHVRRAGREPINDFLNTLDLEESRVKNNWSPVYHYIKQGYYHKQLLQYYNLFDQKDIKIILFEELVKNPKKIIKEIYYFLNVDPNFNTNTNKKLNVSGSPKGVFGWIIMKMRYYNLLQNVKPSKILPDFIINFISKLIYSKPKKLKREEIIRLTKKYYVEDINKLEKLINKKLDHWLS